MKTATLVATCLESPEPPSPVEMIPRILDGLPVVEFDTLRELLDISDLQLGQMVGVSVPTLYRRRQTNSRLDKEASDHIMRYVRLLGLAVKFFDGDMPAARRWLSRPAPALGGLKPLDAARTEVGARAVEQLIGRLEHSVYS